MIIAVNVDNTAMADAVRRVLTVLTREAPGICVVNARDLALHYVRNELGKHLTEDATDLLDEISIETKLPADLVEKVRKSQKGVRT